MAPFWPQVRNCITRCISTIIDEVEADYVSSDDYFPYGDGQEERDLIDDSNEDFKEFPTISLQFLRSPLRVRSITYAETAFKTFNSLKPHIDRAPLGNRILEVLTDLFPEPRPGTQDEVPIHIIIPTTGYTTDKPEDTIDTLLMGLDALRISDDKISITMYQVGSNPDASAKLEAYETVYNTWGAERDLVYSERSAPGRPGAIGNGAISSRKLFRAMSRGLELRGTI